MRLKTMRIFLRGNKKKADDKKVEQKAGSIATQSVPISATSMNGHSVEFHRRGTSAAVSTVDKKEVPVIDKDLMAKIVAKHNESIKSEINIKLKIVNSALNAHSLNPETMLDTKTKLNRMKELAKVTADLENLYNEFLKLFAQSGSKFTHVMKHLDHSNKAIANFVEQTLPDDAVNIINAAYDLVPSLKINVVIIDQLDRSKEAIIYNELCRTAKTAIQQAMNILKAAANLTQSSRADYLCDVIEKIAKHREINPEIMFIEEHSKSFEEPLLSELRVILHARQEKHEAEAQAERKKFRNKDIPKMVVSYERAITSLKKAFTESLNKDGDVMKILLMSEQDRKAMGLISRSDVNKLTQLANNIRFTLDLVAQKAETHSLSLNELAKQVASCGELAGFKLRVDQIKKFFDEELPKFIRTLYASVYQISTENDFVLNQLRLCGIACKNVLTDERIYGIEKARRNSNELTQFFASAEKVNEAIHEYVQPLDEEEETDTDSPKAVTAEPTVPAQQRVSLHVTKLTEDSKDSKDSAGKSHASTESPKEKKESATGSLPSLMMWPQMAAQFCSVGKKYRVVTKDEKAQTKTTTTELKHIKVTFKRAVSLDNVNGTNPPVIVLRPVMFKRSASEADVGTVGKSEGTAFTPSFSG